MRETVLVYGFGSSFRGSERPQDIDLLLLHRSTERASCDFAIDCKRDFQRHLPDVDVVMLSIVEARNNGFVARASAIRLGIIESNKREAQVRALSLKLAAQGSHLP